MKSAFNKKTYRKIFARIFSVSALALIIVLVVQSCKKQQTAISPNAAAVSSTVELATTAVTKEQGLARLNEHFKNEFSPIGMQQVYGVTKQQFTQWLRNSKMAPAEDLYLKPLLAADSIEYVILKNVTVKTTGKLASVGLIGTTKRFRPQFTNMVAVINYNNISIANKHICDWKKCDSYEPCPCILWIDFVVGECPPDKCNYGVDCQGYQAGDCDGELTGIRTYDVISAF